MKGVKSGFNLSAALFGYLWAAYHRAWTLALFLLLLAVALGVFGSLFLAIGANTNIIMWAVQGTYMLIVGMFANKWLLKALKHKGYSERTPFV